MIFEWEKIDRHYFHGVGGTNTHRAKVYGGWIVSTEIYSDATSSTPRNVSVSNVFISDPNHEWSIEE